MSYFRTLFKQVLRPNLLSISIALASIIIVAVVVFAYLLNVTEKDLKQDMTQNSTAAAAFVNGIIGQTSSLLRTVSASQPVKRLNAEETRHYLAKIREHYPYYKGLALADADGNVISTSSDVLPEFNVSSRPFFKQAAEEKALIVTDGMLDKIDNETIVVIANPILSTDNQLDGVVYALLELDILKQRLGNIDLDPGEHLYLLDGNNVPLIHPDNNLVKKRQPLSTGKILRNTNLAKGFLTTFDEVKATQEILAYQKVADSRWLVVVDVPQHYAYNRMFSKLFGPFLFFVLMASPVFFLLIRFGVILTRKQTELVETNKKLSRLVITDSLTGLHNHRYFHDRLKALVDEHSESQESLNLILLDLDFFRYYNDAYGHQAGDAVLLQISEIIKRHCRPQDFVARYGGEEFAIILPETAAKTALSVAETIRQAIADFHFNGEENLPLGKLTVSVGVGCFPAHSGSKDELLKIADQALYKAKYASMKNKVEVYYSVLDELKEDLKKSDQNLFNTIKTFNSVIQAKDRYTYGHSERVMHYATIIGKQLGLDKDTLTSVRYGSFLHDIGKIEIAAPLLNKPGRLTKEEFDIIKQHPTMGADIIKPLGQLEPAVPFIMYHHEHFDGTGYPEGIKGKDIPLIARIGAVADSYDAMSTDRPYKPGKTHLEAIEELRRCSGTQFDPEIVEAFIIAIAADEKAVNVN